MLKSDSIKELATALAKAQGEIENASKNATNPHFRSQYADLAEVLNTVRPALSKHGLSVSQWPSYDNGMASVETILAHSSGEWISSIASAPVMKHDPQGVGSALTYLRRYSLAAVAGIAQEDDDGNGGSGNHHQGKEPAKAATPRALDTATIEQHLSEIYAAADVGALKTAYGKAYRAAKAAGDKAAVVKFAAAKDAKKEDLQQTEGVTA